MIRAILLVFVLLLTRASHAQAGFIVYSSQSAFEAAAQGLATQDFSSAQVSDGSAAFVTGPLTSSTDNVVFSPGDIDPGLVIASSGSSQTGGNNLYVAGVGTVGNDVPSVYTNGSDATMSLTFSPQVDAVGLTLLGFTNNSGPRTFNLSLLGSMSSSPQVFSTGPLPESGSGSFLGFIGTGGEQVQVISFQPSPGANIGVTSLQFGNPTMVTPEPMSLVLMSTSIPFGLAGWLRRRRVVR